MGGELGWGLVVGFREAVGCTEEVIVREVKAAKVVEECHALGGRIEGKGRGVGGDVGEYLLCQMGFAALLIIVSMHMD